MGGGGGGLRGFISQPVMSFFIFVIDSVVYFILSDTLAYLILCSVFTVTFNFVCSVLH